MGSDSETGSVSITGLDLEKGSDSKTDLDSETGLVSGIGLDLEKERRVRTPRRIWTLKQG